MLIYIVIPCFNSATYLNQCLSSILMQEGDFEIHVHIQDGKSEDSTLSIAKHWQALISNNQILNAEKIKITIGSESDKGIYDAIAKGFAKVSSSRNIIMTWLGSDDLLTNGSLATVNKIFEDKKEISWITGRSQTIDSKGCLFSPWKRIHYSRSNIISGLYDGRTFGFIQQEGTFWRSELYSGVGGINTDLKYAGDFDLWKKFACVEKLYTINIPLGIFRYREGQTSSDKDSYYKEVELIKANPIPSALSKDLKLNCLDKYLYSYLIERIPTTENYDIIEIFDSSFTPIQSFSKLMSPITNTTNINSKSCWCGNQKLKEFSPDYYLCSQCGTLILNEALSLDQIRVHDDEHDLYSKEYWLSYQTEEYGYPNIYQRSRQDIPERCLYWLRTLIAYKLPSAKVLELGCSHGGSVALLEWAGFEATGLELSPWVVDFAKKTFDISMLLGPLEDQQIELGSLDAIVLYDVMEHLPDPLSTMRHAASLLKEEGIFIVQTPNYIEGKTYSEMIDHKDHFLDQLKPPEHVYLFNHRSVAKFFKNLGFDFIQYEPQLFDYDMFFVASRHPIVRNTDEQIAHNLLKRSSGRMILALLDQNNILNELQVQYQNSEKDRKERLQVIESQGEEIREIVSRKNKTEKQLQQTQSQLVQSQAELQQTQSQLTQAKMELQSLQQDKLQQLQREIEQTQIKIEVTNREIEAMKTSKFWKARSLWFKIKNKFGISESD